MGAGSWPTGGRTRPTETRREHEGDREAVHESDAEAVQEAASAEPSRVRRLLRMFETPLRQAFIFAADLTPYLSVFMVTLLIGKHYQSREAVGFNLAYSYAATVLAIFAAPGMLSIKRKAATTRTLGTILTAGFVIRSVGVAVGGAAVTAYFVTSPALRPLLPVWLLVFAARFFETATDLTLIISQYNLPAWKHLAIRVSAMLLLFAALLSNHSVLLALALLAALRNSRAVLPLRPFFLARPMPMMPMVFFVFLLMGRAGGRAGAGSRGRAAAKIGLLPAGRQEEEAGAETGHQRQMDDFHFCLV